MFSPCLGDVFFNATVLAQASGASEINLDILLAAFDKVEIHHECYCQFYCLRVSTESGCYAFSLNDTDWTPVSSHAAEVIRPFDDTENENVDPDTLRKALLAAKEK